MIDVMNKVAQHIGRRVISFVFMVFDYFIKFPSNSYVTLNHFIFNKKLFRSIFYKEVYHSGVLSLPIIFIVGGLTGAIFMLLFPFDKLYFDVENVYGGIFSVFIIREIAPLLTSIVVAVRSTIYVTIVISQMKIGGEVRALEIMGIDPIQYLGGMRILAGIITFPIMGFFFCLSAILAGIVCSNFLYGILPYQFIQEVLSVFNSRDLVIFVFKLVVGGYVVFKQAIYHGISARSERNMIVVKTINALTVSIFIILILNFVITLGLYGQQ